MKTETKQVTNCIVKKLNLTYALWFKNSKSFLLLEEPAFEVFKQYSADIDKEEITDFCQNKYGHLEEHISQFVDEIIQQIQFYNNPNNAIEISKKSSITSNNQDQTFFSTNNYKLGNVYIKVNYANEDLKFSIHPLIAHLETDDKIDTKHKIDCFEQQDLLIAKYNDDIVEAIEKDNFEYFTGGVRQLMYSILFNRDYYDWDTMLHASGITSNNQAILFSAAAGSGKTTISALLKAKGYGYLSDDVIASAEGKAFPFPAAISVKEGSVKVLSEYYPELINTQTEETFIGKSVKYIPVFNISENTTSGTPVKAFVFVQYNKNGEFIFEEVEKKEAIQILLKETWVNPKPKSVVNFFNWVEKTPFYSLQYSQTKQALDTVKNIFEQKS